MHPSFLALMSRAVILVGVAWCSVPDVPAQPLDAEASAAERVRQRRSRPRRYSAPVNIHITDWTVVEPESEEKKKEPRIPTDYTPRFMSRDGGPFILDAIPSIDVMRGVDPYMKARPGPNPDEEESPEQNWILPPVPDIDPDARFSDPIHSPWDYLNMQLQSQEETYRNRLYPGRDEEQGTLTEGDYLRQRQEDNTGMLNAGEHLLYSDKSYEDELARDREDDASTSLRDGAGYEPVVAGPASGSEEKEDGYAMVRMSADAADGRLLSDDVDEVNLDDARAEATFGSLYGDESMRRDGGVSFLGGVDSESEEGGFSMTRRLLIGLDGEGEIDEAARDEAADHGEVSENTRRGGFPILANTLRQMTGPSAVETKDAPGAKTPDTSWLSAGGSFLRPLGGQRETASFRSAPTSQAVEGQSNFRVRTPFSSPAALSGTIRSPVSPGVSTLRPTTDFESGPRWSPQTSPGTDVKNLDILMH